MHISLSGLSSIRLNLLLHINNDWYGYILCSLRNLKELWVVFSIIILRLIPKKSLKGEHAFITGAGSGIGKLMAIKLAEMGCKVTLADINLDSVKAV